MEDDLEPMIAKDRVVYIMTYDYDITDYINPFYKELSLIDIKINHVNPKSVIA